MCKRRAKDWNHYTGLYEFPFSDMSCRCNVVMVHKRVGNGTFVVTPLGCKNVYYLLATKLLTDMPAQPLGSLKGYYIWANCIMVRHIGNLTGFYPLFERYHKHSISLVYTKSSFPYVILVMKLNLSQ